MISLGNQVRMKDQMNQQQMSNDDKITQTVVLTRGGTMLIMEWDRIHALTSNEADVMLEEKLSMTGNDVTLLLITSNQHLCGGWQRNNTQRRTKMTLWCMLQYVLAAVVGKKVYFGMKWSWAVKKSSLYPWLKASVRYLVSKRKFS